MEKVRIKDFEIHWIEDLVKKILEKDFENYVVNTGKTTSGKIHVGIMRELIMSDAIVRRLENMGHNATLQMFMDDFDAAKHFPEYVPKEYEDYIGMPFSDIPDPYGCHKSYARHFAYELIDTFDEFELNPRIIWTSEFYEKKAMKDLIRKALDNVSKIRDIYKRFVAPTIEPYKREEYVRKLDSWFPAMVVCERCGRLISRKEGKAEPNRILSYDKEKGEVSYKCHHCGYEGRGKIDELRLKLTWRVDWPAKWYATKVVCEPAGKDHCVKGGAYDTGLEICREVFGYEGPIKVPYEWVRLGERDMKTHKGIVFTPRDLLDIAPAESFRYLVLRSDPMRSVSIKPETYPQVIDEFENFERTYYDEDQKGEFVDYLYPLVTRKRIHRLPFRFAIVISQLVELMGWEKVMEKCKSVLCKLYSIKPSEVTEEDIKGIEETLKRASNWVNSYGPDAYRIKIEENIDAIKGKLSEEQKTFLREFLRALKEKEVWDEKEIQNMVFELGRKLIKGGAKKAFQALYIAIINKKFGPRLAPFVISLDRDWLIERLEKVSS
ncbi:MAG: lysine--tRNA ligase [Candidatus Asgardarchaeia archaeon]